MLGNQKILSTTLEEPLRVPKYHVLEIFDRDVRVGIRLSSASIAGEK